MKNLPKTSSQTPKLPPYLRSLGFESPCSQWNPYDQSEVSHPVAPPLFCITTPSKNVTTTFIVLLFFFRDRPTVFSYLQVLHSSQDIPIRNSIKLTKQHFTRKKKGHKTVGQILLVISKSPYFPKIIKISTKKSQKNEENSTNKPTNQTHPNQPKQSKKPQQLFGKTVQNIFFSSWFCGS